MTGFRFLAAAMSLIMVCSASGAAQDRGYWRAASSTANSITGDIAISDAKLSIEFARFTIAAIRTLTPAETAAVFDADSNARGSGSLYRLNIPASKVFRHHNTLCGSQDTQWMVTYFSGQELQVAFFSGAKMPVFTVDALANSTDLCGTYSHIR